MSSRERNAPFGRLIIYGAQGKIRGITTIENRVLRKEIRAPYRCSASAMMATRKLRRAANYQFTRR